MLVKEEELASESECKKAMNKHCPKYDCDVRPPRQLSEEYSYASEITKEETFISLLSMPSTYLTVGSTLYLMPLSSEDMFDYKKGQGYTTTSRYYWEVGQEMKECPFEEVGSNYGCDFFGKPIADAHWMCNRGGFSLTPLVNLSDALPACEGIVRSKEGLLYKVTDTTDKLNIWSQRIGMVGVAYKDAETDWLRAKVNHIMSNMDSDMCLLQCETLSLEARIHRSVNRILKISSNIILLKPDGTGNKCEVAHGCKLTQPHLMCGNPPRVSITCTGAAALWDPREPYAELVGSCDQPSPYEKLTFTAGHHVYEIDNDIMSLLPSGFMHGKTHDLFAIDHSRGMQFEKVDIDQIRASWTSHKSKQTNATSVLKNKKSDHSGFLTDAINVSREVLTDIWQGMKYAKHVVFLCFISGVAYLTYITTMNVINNKRRTLESPYRVVQTSPHQVRWI
jgi:hypothetical protein